jgi:glycosyltransferase involved in cell wall biosynthesis
VLEAMALGTPVVSTSKGAEGLAVENGKNILIADTPQAFADHIIHLHRDLHLRDTIIQNASHFVRENHDWQMIGNKFRRVVENAI